MTGFAGEMKRRMVLAGLSQAALAAKLFIDPGQISRLVNGVRPPSPDLAARIDAALDAGGELVALAPAPQPRRRPLLPDTDPDRRRPLDDTDVAGFRATIGRLVELDTAHGSEGLHITAARAFRDADRQLAEAGARQGHASDVAAAVAELGEVAAWLAYDAEEQAESRRLATEALLVARMAGDTSMERFLLSHLAMQAVYLDRGAEAKAISERVLAEEPRSRRVRGMFHVRRARALGLLRARDEGLAELRAAGAVLLDAAGPDDPAWSWWLHEAELAVHEGRLLAAAGDARGAVDASARAVLAVPARQGRDGVLYRAWLLHDLVRAHAWRDVEQVAAELVARAGTAGTARVPKIVASALRAAEDPRVRAPRRVKDSVREALAAVEQPT